MKRFLTTTLLALLAGCASNVPLTPPVAAPVIAAPAPLAPVVPPAAPLAATEPQLRFDHSLASLNQSSRVRFIIIHYTVADLDRSIMLLTQKDVSVHYLLTDTPQPFIYTLVDENRAAWHAGTSSWKNFSQLNNSSIGIEIVNPGYTDTPEGRVWTPFAQAQIDQLIPLVKQIAARHGVAPENILGHNEIAPQRREDPGPLFPWKQLAEAGLVPWPDEAQVAAQRQVYEQRLPDIKWFQQQLAQHGYMTPQTGVLDKATRNVLIAFQMRYRPSKFDGVPDAESAALLQVVNAIPPTPSPPPVAIPASIPSPAAVH